MHRHPPASLLALLLTLATAATACTPASGEVATLAIIAEEPTVAPTAVPTTAPLEVPTPTPLPTATPQTTVVPPTATAEPTVIPATAVPEPTATTVPTVTPEPTATAEPTATTVPTVTPEPTVIPAATEPTATSEPVPAAGGETGPPVSHVVANMGFVTLGQAGSTTIRIPAGLVELIGFHEASHPGSKAINAAASGLPAMVLSSRGRGTPAQSAVDIVVPPGEPLRAPVTGTVVAARQYVLYCKHQDSLVYIEPDGLPGWQVRLFHVQGDLPAVGSRVIAGETVVASGGANPLPFESQIDEFTAEPSWPHTHLEVVDTSVPDDRPPGGGC
ncbi:M23 family metallopeptidase [Acidimicrobiales bacterium]|nr:M23 family metallopeptidase [Acidimicrobiales bacterium]